MKSALLYIGDVHALQGNGEVSGISLEASGQVHLTVRLHHQNIPGPILEVEEGLLAVGYGETFEQAVEMAVETSIGLLVSSLGLQQTDAYLLLGCSSDLVIGHLTGRIKSVGILIPPYVLETRQIFG